MLAQPRRDAQEPETLKRHREMYEKRLRYLDMTQGKTDREVADKANSPRVFKKAAETTEAHSRGKTPGTHSQP
jgi:hypothetical protein